MGVAAVEEYVSFYSSVKAAEEYKRENDSQARHYCRA